MFQRRFTLIALLPLVALVTLLLVAFYVLLLPKMSSSLGSGLIAVDFEVGDVHVSGFYYK